MSAIVTVRGAAVASAKPDDADLTFTLSALYPSADEAFSDVAERSQALKSILTIAGIPERDRVTSGISVREEREREKDQWVHRGYLAEASVISRLSDPDLIGRLMKIAIEDVDAEVAGPRWRVAADNPAHTEARKAAIADARRRADAYAEALGVRLGAVLEVSEPGLRERVSASRLVMADQASMFSSEDVEVEAGDVDIRCSIDVVYSLEQ